MVYCPLTVKTVFQGNLVRLVLVVFLVCLDVMEAR